MKRILLILAACACACAWAGVASARLGSLGRNDTVVTNVTDVTPGNYETVSNRAMTASAYTDAALGAFAATGAVRRAEIYGTPTRWTDATGCVWEVVTNTYEWKCYYGLPDEIYEVSGPEVGEVVCTWFLTGSKGTTGNAYSASPTETRLEFTVASVPGGIIVAKLEGIASTNYVGHTALTNDIPRTAGDVGAYPAASGSALESGKQDRLPYPTNAIPFSAIDGAPNSPSVFYDAAGGAATVSGATLTYQAASNSVGSVALLAGTNILHITAPSAIPNRVRDFGLTVTTDDAATITLDTSVSWRFDSASTNLSAGSWNRIYCTESPTGVFSLQLWTPDSSQESTP